MVPVAKLPLRDAQGWTVWVTRERPMIDRIACPWLIRRFVDPNAIFMSVAAIEVAAVGERFDAAPFDLEGVFRRLRGECCSFDAMIEELGLNTPRLPLMATIVRGADTGRLDRVPLAAGLLADHDLAQLKNGFVVYNALYRGCRDAADETHNWLVRTAEPTK
jgi:hypothetical protein